MRKRHSAQFKVKVALEAAKGEKTMAQLCKQYQVHRVQIQDWKKSLLEALPEVFSAKRSKSKDDNEKLVDELYKQIGQLRVAMSG